MFVECHVSWKLFHICFLQFLHAFYLLSFFDGFENISSWLIILSASLLLVYGQSCRVVNFIFLKVVVSSSL